MGDAELRDHLNMAIALMDRFVRDTGVEPPNPARRYLWTDAFAVCNLIGIHAATGDEYHLDTALMLIEQVHFVLGRFREDEERQGWISGVNELEGFQRPTARGLRIGKPRPERPLGEPLDERAGWDRDGQYFHYLTKWMHALCRAARAADDEDIARQAGELARASMQGCARRNASGQLLGFYWKMSTDLSRPLIAATGAQDALDGYLTLRDVAATLDAMGLPEIPALDDDMEALAALCRDGRWGTDDPLGLGGLLFDACRLAQLMQSGARDGDARLLAAILHASIDGLKRVSASPLLSSPPAHRLAFRELGLAIGLKALPMIVRLAGEAKLHRDLALGDVLEAPQSNRSLAGRITATWLDGDVQRQKNWLAHQDINDVMLATALAPDGFLNLRA